MNPRFLIAIQPDEYASRGGRESSSARWADVARARGHDVRWVDVFRPDILDQLAGCQGFLWRHGHYADHRGVARRLLPVIENRLGLCVYPDQNTCWHYDDKITQSYLLAAAGIPMPETRVFWTADGARRGLEDARYPLVLKLWSGAGSRNVRLVRSAAEALPWVDRLFGPGVYQLFEEEGFHPRRALGRARRGLRWILTGRRWNPGTWWDLHKNYLMVQEFIPGNEYDTRVTVIGRRAFGFRRLNRARDFRASGSGRIEFDPAGVDPKFIRLAFRVAADLKMQSCAVDGLWKDGFPVITEVSYTYASWAIRECPGHWEMEGDPQSAPLAWVPGPLWPEEAQMDDFLRRLDARFGAGASRAS
jgi:glutathione synthase/RimK-type ligase-like ATP-grasp enzyme